MNPTQLQQRADDTSDGRRHSENGNEHAPQRLGTTTFTLLLHEGLVAQRIQ